VLRASARLTSLQIAAYRVPDTQGAISVRWTEGQPVRVRAVADLWAYAESSAGDAGWVHQDNLVFY
jgi:SH3-like domain-containing protein